MGHIQLPPVLLQMHKVLQFPVGGDQIHGLCLAVDHKIYAAAVIEQKLIHITTECFLDVGLLLRSLSF